MSTPPAAPAFDYDVFISYSARDESWVQTELLPRLESWSLHCISPHRFEAGAPRVDEIERAVASSRKTLLILSPDYLADAWAVFGDQMVQTLDPASRARRLIPLIKTTCKLPERLDKLVSIDFTSRPSWERLRLALDPSFSQAQLAKALDSEEMPYPAPLPAGSRMPLSRNPLFVGREDDLRVLASVLKAGGTAAIGQIAAATGLGGIGKTQLACEFAHRYGQFFVGGVFWLSFADAAVVPSEVAACGGASGMDLGAEFEAQPLDKQVQTVLTMWEMPLPRLLVFDNCEDEALLDEWRPKTGGSRVLVTSRRQQWSVALGVQALHLEVLPRPESIALLRKFRDDLREDDTDLNTIAEELGDLPLALHLAGSFLLKYRHAITPAQYRERLRKPTLLDDRSLRAADISPTKHVQHVARTFEQSYERLDPADPTDALAIKLLARAAYFAPGEPLPRWLLLTLDLRKDDPDVVLQAEDSIIRLIDLGLLEAEDNGALRLHRLLMAFVRAVVVDVDAQTAVEHTMFRLVDYYNGKRDPRPMLVLQQHLRFITNTAQEREDQLAGRLCNTLGYYLQVIGDYRGAKHYYEQSLVISIGMLGIDHLDTVSSMNNMGAVLQHLGDLRGARTYFEQALAVIERVLGAEHPDKAPNLNNLGAVLYAQGDLEGARVYFQRALEIRERVLGMEHPDTLYSLNNIGALLHRQGNLAGARDYYERALSMQKQILGTNHPDTAQSMNNLGSVLQDLGDLEGARTYFEQALVVMEQVLGVEHPDTAHSLNNLGAVLYEQGELEGARAYFQRALEIRERVLGMEHPDTAMSLGNLCAVLHVQGDLVRVLGYLERALAILEQVLGMEHPDTAQTIANLGVVLQDLGDLVRAKRYYERALAIFEQRLGPNHPNTQGVRRNLVALDAQQQAEQQIAEIEQQVQAAVDQALAEGRAKEKVVLAAVIEQVAQMAKDGEKEGSPYLALAMRLRALAARLRGEE